MRGGGMNKIVPKWKIVQALVYMAEQYLTRLDGELDHDYMTAGEHALECLEAMGFVKDFKIIDYPDNESWFIEQFEQPESDHIIVSRAEYEQMQKDAERYRWVTCNPYFIADTKLYIHEYSSPETKAQLDEAIDKAMKG
jgi:hypothetical protein